MYFFDIILFRLTSILVTFFLPVLLSYFTSLRMPTLLQAIDLFTNVHITSNIF